MSSIEMQNQSSKVSQNWDEITILNADRAPEDQIDLSFKLPAIVEEGTEYYDLLALVCATMKAYKLDPMCGVFVEYYSSSMGSYMQADYLFNEST